MEIKTYAFMPTAGVPFGSDVETLHYRDGNLNIILACSHGGELTVQGLSVTFARPTGFRLKRTSS